MATTRHLTLRYAACLALSGMLLLCSIEAIAQAVACPAIALPGFSDRTVVVGMRVELVQPARYPTPSTTPSYQWYHNGVPLPGANGTTLVIPAAQVADSGYYRLADNNDPCYYADGRLSVLSGSSVISWGTATVPAGLSDITAVAGGRPFDYARSHYLALRSDGTVAIWGNDPYSEGFLTPPAPLSDVVAIKAGDRSSLALKSDGTVVAWGNNQYGQSSPPAGLAQVIAITTGRKLSVALKLDGTVDAWGDPSVAPPPAGLSNVIAIAAGDAHALALKADGTVVAWGGNEYGQTTLPAGLSDVVAIDAASSHSIALKSDGTAMTWGCDNFGPPPCTPASLVAGTGVTAIGARPNTNVLRKPGGIVQILPSICCVTDIGDYFDPTWWSYLDLSISLDPRLAVLASVHTNAPLKLSAASLDFGSQATGSTSPARLLWLTNVSDAAVTLSGLTFAAPYSAMGGSCFAGRVLVPGATCALGVGFAPSDAGAANAMLRIDLGNPDGTPIGTRQIGLSGAGTTLQSLALGAGFNLLGNGTDAGFDVLSHFGNVDAPLAGISDRVVSVWKWDVAATRWQFFSPLLSTSANSAYAASHEFGLLSNIGPKEGYWVNADQALGLPVQLGANTPFTAANFAALPAGWNLLATGDTTTPRGFNAALSVTPPQPGVTPQSFISLWAWDRVMGNWYFHAPGLDAQGGSALIDYINNHNYLDFTSRGKNLEPGMGFWVMKP